MAIPASRSPKDILKQTADVRGIRFVFLISPKKQMTVWYPVTKSAAEKVCDQWKSLQIPEHD